MSFIQESESCRVLVVVITFEVKFHFKKINFYSSNISNHAPRYQLLSMQIKPKYELENPTINYPGKPKI